MKTKKAKPPTPKNLYVRYVNGGTSLSVGEYINGKWRNVVEPFRLDDLSTVAQLKGLVDTFRRHEQREVEYVNYGGDNAVKELERLFRLVNEKGGE